MRAIPAAMATQHPDNAQAPYWNPKQAFISAHQEIEEALICFKDLGCGEYMWDWEGKHADAAVIDRLFSEHYDYFSAHQLGRDKFLTFRVPNIWEEKGYNLLQAMTVILSSEDFARDLKFNSRPLFEVILPMTERAEQIMHMQQLFDRLARFKSLDFTPDRLPNDAHLDMIPLVESVESQVKVDQLLFDYLKLYESNFKSRPEYLRVFLACSDSALSSGFLAGLIGNKIALAKLHDFSVKNHLPIYPILGCGSLRFRGGLAPDTVDRFTEEFSGVRTVTIQSSFRYDNPKAVVTAAIKKLNKTLPKLRPLVFDPAIEQTFNKVVNLASGLYKDTLKQLLADMQPYFEVVPRRRERRQHIGLLAYSRNLGGETLPRAITFTAGFYSVGIPPELIGSGRALKKLKSSELNLLRQNYPNIREDFIAAGAFLNRANLSKLARGNPAWLLIERDINELEQVLDIKLGPKTKDEKQHQALSTKLLSSKSKPAKTQLITDMAMLRKSLG